MSRIRTLTRRAFSPRDQRNVRRDERQLFLQGITDSGIAKILGGIPNLDANTAVQRATAITASASARETIRARGTDARKTEIICAQR